MYRIIDDTIIMCTMMNNLPPSEQNKPHALCIPFPAQGHINPMLKVAMLLHREGCHVTFVHTEFNYQRLLQQNPASLWGLPGFQFETIPDGLPQSDPRLTLHGLVAVTQSINKTGLAPLRALLTRVGGGSAASDVPPVSCMISDSILPFTVHAAEELGLPNVSLYVGSAAAFLGLLHIPQFIEKGIIPLKDDSYLTNGYLDMVIDWIPGMKVIRLRDLPSFIRTSDRDDSMLNLCLEVVEKARRASAIIFNTFELLEHDVLEAVSSMFPRVYPIGLLNQLLDQVPQDDDGTSKVRSSLWEEDKSCLRWLDTKEPMSVVYVNFGSIAEVTSQQLVELAWGLANSEQSFLWVIRPDPATGESAVLPLDFAAKTEGIGLVTGWAPQEEVLRHPSVGGFLTHCGWNSITESISEGVPMICWPFGADQPTNCKYCCVDWGIGVEVDGCSRRSNVEAMVRELMCGEKGAAMRKKATEWKRLAQEASSPGGSSRMNFDQMIREVLLRTEEPKLSKTIV